jgi:hypothetical protein
LFVGNVMLWYSGCGVVTSMLKNRNPTDTCQAEKL